jgi:hypothetical protein
MTRQTIIVVGAGGQARELRWMLDEINARESQFEFLGYVVTVVGAPAWPLGNTRGSQADKT